MVILPRIVKVGLQSSAILTVADVATQCLIEQQPRPDLERTLRWSVAGLCLHGPYFFIGFSKLDAIFGATATHWTTVAQKTITAQLVLFPPYLALLFSFMAVAEGQRSLSQIWEKLRQRVPPAFVGGSIFWPVANGINFALVTTQQLRMLYLACCGAVWNSYLSWANARGSRPASAAGSAAKER